ncbi:tetratricopeptide repeat protein [Streptomyces sp. NPDC096033]|uniref:tetratricopeptide repeat protein n=1 Tax=Streptomyces sp. NPDC096033 TaxID=3366071 RepID=UPI003819F1B6
MAFFRSRDRRENTQRADDLLAGARALYEAGRLAEAEAEARSVAAAMGRHPDDLAVPMAVSIAALAASGQGRHAEALAVYDERLPVTSEAFGEAHRVTLKLRLGRAEVLNQLGRPEEAAYECGDVAAVAGRAGLPYVAMDALTLQIRAFEMLGDFAAVEELARGVLGAHDGFDRYTVRVRFSLAFALNVLGRHEEALAVTKSAGVLDRAFTRAERAQETGLADLNEAMALFGLDRAAEARPRASACYQECLAAFGADHLRTVQARALLDRIDGA